GSGQADASRRGLDRGTRLARNGSNGFGALRSLAIGRRFLTLRASAATIAQAVLCCGLVLLGLTRAAPAETLFERGAYLVNTVAACGRCHTPRLAQGRPDPAMELAGGFEFTDPAIGHIVGPNLTP